MSDEWVLEAACRGMAAERGYDIFYEEDLEAEAKSVCAGCNVRLACLQDALENHIWYGIYGGMTPKERSSHYRRWRYWSSRNHRPYTMESLAAWSREAG